jgi:anti-sigma B factor antagonist
MDLQLAKSGAVTVIRFPVRSLDASNAEDFKLAASALLVDNQKIVFDMALLGFVDSTGLGALVSCVRKARAAKGEIRLCSLQKPVRALFELVRMHRVFDIFNSVNEAVHSYAVQQETKGHYP